MIPTAVRRPLLVDGVLSRLMDALSGGAILAGLGLLAGADNLQLGILAALPFLAQVVQLPAVGLLLRLRDRRRIVVLCAGLARLLLLLLAILLVVRPAVLDAPLLLATMAALAVLAVVATAAWNWWMRDLLPPEELGSFFSQRLRGATLVSIVALLGAGAVLDAFTADGNAARGYAVLLGLAGLAGGGGVGEGGVAALARTPHAPPPPSPSARRSLQRMAHAFRNAPKGVLAALSLSTVAATFALPFTAVYLLRGLGYSYLLVVSMSVLSLVAYLLALRGWAHVSDRHGDRSLLALALATLGLALAGWVAAGWAPGWGLTAWLAGLHFLAGFALGGIELANTNLLLRTTPADEAAAHLAVVSVVRAAVAGLGVVAAGALWQGLGSGVLWSAWGWQLRGFQVLCAVSLVVTMAAAVSLRAMPAGATGPVVDVARAVRREVHQMSSVAGIRGLIHAVSYTVEFMALPFAARQGRRR
jgi:MFS family permease